MRSQEKQRKRKRRFEIFYILLPPVKKLVRGTRALKLTLKSKGERIKNNYLKLKAFTLSVNELMT
jgi:hypothetical protein